MRILFLSAEAAPFAKRGGLGDVAGSLPIALRAKGHDVRVIMPAYAEIENGYPGVEIMPLQLQVPIRGGLVPAGVFQSTLPNSDVPIYFIGERSLFYRPEVYGYEDDPYRFAFFSRAALDFVITELHWKPDLVHAHDWHTAPALTWLETAGRSDPRYGRIASLFTIHNLAHQGRTTWDIFDYLNIQSYSLNEESFDEVNFMARGIHHATLVNTVSPTYAQEIMTPEEGAGLDRLLRFRRGDVHGILNGIDVDRWNPADDDRLPVHYSADTLDDKRAAKRALQSQLGLPIRDDVPLLAMVSRLDWQKGLDIMGHPLHRLLNGAVGEAQVVILGTGAKTYERMFAQLAEYHHDKMRAILAYSAGLAPLIYAGSDMFMMPSRFEPCGLGQLIAMRYGSVPIARATGGLADTVQEGKTGFLFKDLTVDAFWDAMQRAVTVYYHRKDWWRSIQLNGMRQNFSWEQSADGYLELYAWATERVKYAR